jgi:CHAT domain-containing protein
MNNTLKLFFIIIFSQILNAQSWHNYSDSIYNNIKNNNIDKAKYFIQLADIDIYKHIVIKDTIYADYIYRKGVVLNKEKNTLALFQEALKIWENSSKKNLYKLMRIYYFIGEFYFNNKEDDLAIEPFEKCFEINKKNNLKINQNFISTTNILAYLYFNKKEKKKATFYADEYISVTKLNAFEDYNFNYAKIFDYKNENETREKVLLEFLKKYEKDNKNKPELLFKIYFELFVFYEEKNNQNNIYKKNSFGEKAIELYFKCNLNDLNDLQYILISLQSSYHKIGSYKQEQVIADLLHKVSPEVYENKDFYDNFDILNGFLFEKKYIDFSTYFKKFEQESRSKNNLYDLIKLYVLSLDCFENNILFSKQEITAQFDYIQNNKQLLSADNFIFLDLYLTEYYIFVENNINTAYQITLKHSNEENLDLKLAFYKSKILCEFHLGLYSEKSVQELISLAKKVKGYYDQEYENLLIDVIFDLYGNFPDIKLSNQIVTNLFAPFQFKIIGLANFYTNKEIMSYGKNNFYKRYYSISFLYKNPKISSEINIGCYQNELLVKGLSLRNQQRIQNNIQKSGDATLKSNYEHFVANKRQLVKLQELPIDKRPALFEKLTIETELLEKDLIRQSALFADAKKSLSTTWKQIQDQLKHNEVAIDLVAFNYYNKKWTDSIVYSAFVITKSCKYPKFISLFEQKQLNALLQRSPAEHDSIQTKKLNRQYTDRVIADLFLKPLLPELENVTTIYLSPAGLSHQINFSALPISDSQTFGAKYALHLLGSTTTLIDYTPGTINKKENPELLLYGDIDYGKTNAIKKEINEDSTISSQIDFNETNTRGVSDSFGNLGGTLKELNTIADLAKVEGFQTTQIKQADATEESIKALDGRSTPYILHLATHGFFFPDPKVSLPDNTIQINESVSNSNRDAMYKSSEDPMMRSGLAMAGANKYWKKPIEKLTTDDGILTANEISNLDLSACQLVVLSACETGLGDINGSEGVFGLQRAFKIAGVKNIIMSLWKVPDSQTSELFEVFYSECFAGKTIHEAFQSAQSQMKAKYSPFYWAGFVLLE